MRESDAMKQPRQAGTNAKPQQPAVSVIVPVHNGEKYLEECLESIANQQFRDFEVLMVNDGSTDSSPEICKRFEKRDRRFRLLNRENSGVSAARNMGLDRAVGRWVMFLDADDTLNPRTLADLTGMAQETGAPVVIGGLYRDTVDRQHTLPRRGRVMQFSSDEIVEAALYQTFPNQELGRVCGILYERNLFACDIRFKEGMRYEDLDLSYRLLMRASSAAMIDLPYYFYRQHPASFIHTFSPDRLCVLDVVDEMVETIARERPALLAAARDRRFSAHYNILLLLLANGCTDRALIHRCYSAIKAHRWQAIANPRVRLKNKLGAALSLGGLPLIRLFASSAHIT